MFLVAETTNGIKSTPPRTYALKFMMWLGIGSIIMMFAGLTSAYIVRQAQGNWTQFDLPSLFWATTFIILMSSGSMYWALSGIKKGNIQMAGIAMLITIILGILFVAGQYFAWKQLYAQGIFLQGNPSGAFLYVITGLHAFHIIGGLFFLILVYIRTLLNKYNSENYLHFSLCSNYWHFVDVLWVYLFIFLLYSHTA